MRFLADESFPCPSARYLESKGYIVERFAHVKLGASDREVIEYAIHSKAILLTFDKDFGQLLFQEGRIPPGLVFFRYRGPDPEWAGKTLLRIISENLPNLGIHFLIIEEDKVRVRSLR